MLKSQLITTFLLAFVFINPSFSTEMPNTEPEGVPQPDNSLTTPLQSKQNKSTSYIPISTHIKTPIRVLIDVRSNHSDGKHDFNTLIALAKKRHIEAMVFTEHDRFTIRFGIDPIPYLFGYSQEHPSLYQTGLQQFLIDLNEVQQSEKMTLFAGTESTPGYYWQGIPFKNLSLHQAERHLITLGAETAEQIQSLTSYDLRHGYGNRDLSLLFWFVITLLLLVNLMRKRKRNSTLLFAASFIVFMVSWLMKPTITPENDFINSAHQQGLFVIWAHPGTLSGLRDGPMGVQLNTPPYSELVFKNSNADAFAAVYGDTDINTVPGGLWDLHMMRYMKRYHPKPIWAVAAGDYHEEGQANEFLGNFPMDVWAESAKAEDILTALKQGRMVSWGMQKDQNIATKALYLEYTDINTGQKKQLFTGDETTIGTNQVQAVIALHDLADSFKTLNLQGQWIVDGKVTAQVKLSTAKSDFVEVTNLNLSAGQHVIRFQIPAQHGLRMESNPFLIHVSK